MLVVADAGPSDPYDWTEGPAVGCHPQMFAVFFYTITLGLKERTLGSLLWCDKSDIKLYRIYCFILFLFKKCFKKLKKKLN